MLKNYFTIALRVFKNRPIYTLINVVGLSFGITCCLVSYMMLHHELTFDSFHEKKDNLYKVVLDYQADWGMDYLSSMTYSVAPIIRENLPDFEKVLELQGPYQNLVSIEDELGNINAFSEDYVLYASNLFFDMFDFEILYGAGPEALKEPGKVFLTEKLAKKYFNEENPIGKYLQLQKDAQVAEVVGIVKDPPMNTSTPFDMIISYETFRQRYPGIFSLENTFTWGGSVYLEFPDDHDHIVLESKLTETMKQFIPDDADKYQFRLQPLTQIHTAERYGDGTHYVVPSQLIIGLILLSFLLIITSCLNFINLSTAQAIKRSKEVGIRKTIGGRRGQLIGQFLLETFLIVILATLAAFTFSQLFLSILNDYLSSVIPYKLEIDFSAVLFALFLAITITVLAGLYPALVLAGYQPIEAIRSNFNSQKGSGSYFLRKVLITSQFVFSIFLISVTIIIASQIRYIHQVDLGFDQHDIVHIDLKENILNNPKVALFRDDLLNKSYISHVSASKDTPAGGGFGWNCSFKLPQNQYEDGYDAEVKFVDSGYINTYQISILKGDNLSNRVINDSTFHVLVNEKLLKTLNIPLEKAIGTQFDFNGNLKAVINGVTEDFNSSSLKEKISPVILAYRPSEITGVALKLSGKKLYEVKDDLKASFKSFFPEKYFDYFLLEDFMEEEYTVDTILFNLIIVFSLLALLISMMGLYGLVTFMTERYAKVIGVRKIFGASIHSIMMIFVKEYAVMLIVAFIVASPLAYIVSEKFVSEFAYQIQIGPIYFVLSLLIIAIIAALTVGRQSYKAATQNLINLLRYE